MGRSQLIWAEFYFPDKVFAWGGGGVTALPPKYFAHLAAARLYIGPPPAAEPVEPRDRPNMRAGGWWWVVRSWGGRGWCTTPRLPGSKYLARLFAKGMRVGERRVVGAIWARVRGSLCRAPGRGEVDLGSASTWVRFRGRFVEGNWSPSAIEHIFFISPQSIVPE